MAGAHSRLNSRDHLATCPVDFLRLSHLCQLDSTFRSSPAVVPLQETAVLPLYQPFDTLAMVCWCIGRVAVHWCTS